MRTFLLALAAALSISCAVQSKPIAAAPAQEAKQPDHLELSSELIPSSMPVCIELPKTHINDHRFRCIRFETLQRMAEYESTEP